MAKPESPQRLWRWRFVAYDAPVADNVSARDIFVLATDGSREMTAVEGRANDFAPLWAPDNSQLIFLSDRAGSDSLWTVAMENGRPKGSPEPVKGGVRPSTLLGITQTGTLYYGVRASDRRNIHAVELNERMHAITSPVPATERFVAGNMSPSWSGDGASLAYYSLRNPTVLVIQSSNTGEERTVPVPAGVAPAQPRWFPDNRSVLILAQNAQGPGSTFYRLEVDTGKTEPLLGVGRGIGSYDLAPDGKTIFYSFQSSGQPGATGYYTGRLMRFDIGSNREVELKKNEWFINVAVSPDGTELAYLKSLRDDALRNAGEYPSVVEVIPAAGGPSREVFRNPIWLTGVRYGNLAWTPDGRSLIFVQDDGEFWKVSAGGGKPEKMGILRPKGPADGIRYPAIHPDGRRMVFTAVESDGAEVWALEKFLR
jgi:Tol biopolymer transport system component